MNRALGLLLAMQVLAVQLGGLLLHCLQGEKTLLGGLQRVTDTGSWCGEGRWR